MSLVSVIIPAYNSASSLTQCLNSVLEQSYQPIEVIVINDGSTDNTADVIKSYGDKIIYLEQSNLGQGAARNTGLKRATGEFIAFLDADDYWKPEFLDNCIKFLEANPSLVAVNTGLIIRMHDGTELIKPALLTQNNAPQKPCVIEEFFAFWAEHDHIRTGSAVIRKCIIDKAGGQREDLRISQDLEYWGYIATYGKWGYIPEPLWVGNSRQAAKEQGWLKKYRKRRKLCPDVEQWESRILPRLILSQKDDFDKIRGRVALGYAHNKILGGYSVAAKHIVRKYGNTMPDCVMSKLLNFGSHYGIVSWSIACGIIYMREWSKAMRLSLNNWFS